MNGTQAFYRSGGLREARGQGREARKTSNFQEKAMVDFHYRDLKVWQKAMDLAEACYRSTGSFPPEERYGMTSQIRRSSVSVATNIAEGHSRFHTKEFLNHLSMARGSLAESETLLML